MPLEAAFEQIVEENGLDYAYNPSTRTVTVYGKGDKGGTNAQNFVNLGDVDYATVREALSSFHIDSEGLSYDPRTNLLAVGGDQDQAQQIVHLVETLKEQSKARSEKTAESRKQEVADHKAVLEQKAYQDLQHLEIKVIPLRFADVGPTTKEFQGKSVTIPGIAETLEAMLGVNDKRSPPRARNDQNDDSGSSDDKDPLGRLTDVNKPTISIDQRSNSVIVRGTPEAIAEVEKAVRQLDRPLEMVEIEVVIATAQVGVTEQLGVNWRGSGFGSRGLNRSGAIDTGTSGGQVKPGTSGSPFSTSGFDALSLLPATGVGGTVASFVLQNNRGFLQAQLQALAEKNKARILSAPRLVTLDNIAARITRSQNIFVQVNTGSLIDGVGLEEIKTGLTLDITPSLIPSMDPGGQPLIRLSLSAENSAPGSGSFGQIDVHSQQVQTQVLVPDGATFVIGGLFDDTRRDGETGVPVLKDVPGLGRLFRTNSSDKSLGETIFFITPHVVDERQFVPEDVATSIGSERYIERQRRILSGVTQEMNDGPTTRFPNTVRTLDESAKSAPNSVRTLEEDE
jgi:type II secretory pathway component GspD/PulD (secretin)